jgi:uncharacterized protein YjiS (DUF1127 family)
MRTVASSTALRDRRPAKPARLSLLSALALWRSRRKLVDLSDAQLRDAGITADQARIEAARPLWDAPDAWKC